MTIEKNDYLKIQKELMTQYSDFNNSKKIDTTKIKYYLEKL
jgi:predicted P-loop ATPase